MQRLLPPISAAIPICILMVTALSVILTGVQHLAPSSSLTSSWILALYGLPGVASILLTAFYRQPILLTGNIVCFVFIASIGRDISYPELVGASMVAGGAVFLIGALGLTERIAAWLPAPIVLAVIAGVVLPYVAGIFTALGKVPVLAGSAFLAYVVSRRVLGRVPPIFVALVVGLAVAAVDGWLGPVPSSFEVPVPVFTVPEYTLSAIATISPVFVILITLQSNLPSGIFMRTQGYDPPERVIDMVSGAGTAVGSLFGPMAVSVAVLVVPLVAGPDAGDRQVRHWAVYVCAGALVLIGLFASIAADLVAFLPLPLLLTLAGLSLVGVLTMSLQQITRGPLVIGPIFAFAIAFSRIELLGFGPLFWSLVLGTALSLVLEPAQYKQWRAETAAAAQPRAKG